MNAPQENGADRQLQYGFRLGDLQVDPADGRVAGTGGSEKLDPKVMDVLVLMARHAGHVVSREELLAQLWPHAVVSDDALTRCFYELRRQLSQAGGSERYRDMVETLPKRGYRLNAAIGPVLAAPATLIRSRRRFAAITIGSLVLIAALAWPWIGKEAAESPQMHPSAVPGAVNSIAVLPFLDLSESHDQGYFSDGIAEEILNRLAQSSDLRVIARTSSFAFRNSPVQASDIAGKLDVTHLLEGSVRRSGDRVRITVQLVSASDNSHVWSNTYDHSLGDLFAVQDDIAAAVAAALQSKLAHAAQVARPPASAAAYERFLQAKYFYERRAPGDIDLAIKLYREAIAVDAEYAVAWAALSGAYGLQFWDGDHSREWLTRQRDAALRAVELDPDLVDAQVRLGNYYFNVSDKKRAVEHFQIAARLDPRDPLLAHFADGRPGWFSDDIDAEIAIERNGLSRDPLSAGRHQNLGLLLFRAGSLDEATAEFRKALELNPAAGWDSELEICRIFVIQGRYDDARAAILRLPEGGRRDQGLALLIGAPGWRVEADAALARQAALAGDDMHSIRLADAYAWRGMRAEAFAVLQRAKDRLARDQSWMARTWYFQNEMRLSPFLKPLQADSRWAALMAEPG